MSGLVCWVSGLIFRCLDMYFGCLDLYLGVWTLYVWCMDLYLGVCTCICVLPVSVPVYTYIRMDGWMCVCGGVLIDSPT